MTLFGLTIIYAANVRELEATVAFLTDENANWQRQNTELLHDLAVNSREIQRLRERLAEALNLEHCCERYIDSIADEDMVRQIIRLLE